MHDERVNGCEVQKRTKNNNKKKKGCGEIWVQQVFTLKKFIEIHRRRGPGSLYLSSEEGQIFMLLIR